MNWAQLKTIVWLRWCLSRNQLRRGGGFGAAIAAIAAVGIVLFAGVSFAGALLGGWLGLGEAKAPAIMGVWFGVTILFLFFWMLSLITELQRSESIDLQRLLHLPVALGQMFVVNYIASHLNLTIVLLLPGMMGLAIGLILSRGPAMLLLIPLVLGMVFMITAWTYYLRGWLSAMMGSPRRRRTIVMLITLGFILIAQGPNLYFNVIRRHNQSRSDDVPSEAQRQRETRKLTGKEKLNQFLMVQKFVPPLWLPAGAHALAEGRPLPACLGAVGCFAIGALGLRRAYRSTLRFYQGESGRKSDATADPQPLADTESRPTSGTSTRFLEVQLPGVPEQAAALGAATFRSMLRAPEVKIAWATSFIVTLIVGASVLFQSGARMPEPAKPFVVTGAVTFSVFMLVQFLANQFGFDRDGFRALVLSPADRRLILAGKNLASLPVCGGFGVMLVGLTALWLRLPPLLLIAAMLQLLAMLVLAGIVGNLLSILVPYRIQAGSMKPTKMPGRAMAVMIVCHMFFPLAMAPVFLPPLAGLLSHLVGWRHGDWLNLLLSGAIAVAAGFTYWKTLGSLGRLLQRRETKILAVVTVEVE